LYNGRQGVFHKRRIGTCNLDQALLQLQVVRLRIRLLGVPGGLVQVYDFGDVSG
jgi:hypothetical protein